MHCAVWQPPVDPEPNEQWVGVSWLEPTWLAVGGMLQPGLAAALAAAPCVSLSVSQPC